VGSRPTSRRTQRLRVDAPDGAWHAHGTLNLVAEIRAEASEYSAIGDSSNRASQRARVLTLLDGLALKPAALTVRAVGEAELRGDAVLRGAVLMHHDLVSRSPLTSFEVAYTATRGTVLVADLETLPGFPVGVALALPATSLPDHRRDLFDDAGPMFERAERVVIYGLATNPPRLGAGAALIRAARIECRARARSPRLTAFSPLTGLRARVIGAVEDPTALTGHDDVALLREQLSGLLSLAILPPHVPEPARSWLAAEARAFAVLPSYRVGGFHRHLGAELAGVADLADEVDSDSMWARVHFDYGVA
jgi:hypothetical protein